MEPRSPLYPRTELSFLNEATADAELKELRETIRNINTGLRSPRLDDSARWRTERTSTTRYVRLEDPLKPPAGESKAVLAALRALLAKIDALRNENRRLQTDLTAEQQRSASAAQIERQKLEMQFQQQIQTAHTTYDQLKNKSEEEIRSLRSIESELRTSLHLVTEERNAVRERLKITEERVTHLQSKLEDSREDTNRAEHEKIALDERLAQLHNTLSKEMLAASTRSAELEVKIKQLEEASSKQKKENEERYATLYHEFEVVVSQKEQIEEYLAHVMSLAPAKKPLQKTKTKSSTATTRTSKSLTNLTRATIASKSKTVTDSSMHKKFGYPLPFTVGNPAATSHSVPANVQELLSKKPLYVDSQAKSKIRSVASPEHAERELKVDLVENENDEDTAVSLPPSRPHTAEHVRPLEQKAGELKESHQFLDIPRRAAQHAWAESTHQEEQHRSLPAYSPRTQARSDAVLQVIESLQEELRSLNTKYNTAREEARHLAALGGGTAFDKYLVEIKREIDIKTDQLETLREHHRRITAGKTVPSVTFQSPQAKKTYEKKIKSMRLLGEFRRIFQDDE